MITWFICYVILRPIYFKTKLLDNFVNHLFNEVYCNKPWNIYGSLFKYCRHMYLIFVYECITDNAV